MFQNFWKARLVCSHVTEETERPEEHVQSAEIYMQDSPHPVPVPVRQG